MKVDSWISATTTTTTNVTTERQAKMYYNNRNFRKRFYWSDLPGILVVILVVLVFSFVIWMQIDVAIHCNGFVVYDGANVPRCIDNPNVIVPVGRLR